MLPSDADNYMTGAQSLQRFFKRLRPIMHAPQKRLPQASAFYQKTRSVGLSVKLYGPKDFTLGSVSPEDYGSPILNNANMNSPKNQGNSVFSPAPERNADTEVAVVALTEIQKLAAERRALAESALAQAREFEEQLVKEREAIVALVSEADATFAGERDGEERVQAAREILTAALAERDAAAQREAELSRAEDAAQAEFAAAQERLQNATAALDAALAARAEHQPVMAEKTSAAATAQAGFDAAQLVMDERQGARTRASAAVAEMRARIEALSGSNGLSSDAVKRIVDRRIADALRNGSKTSAT